MILNAEQLQIALEEAKLNSNNRRSASDIKAENLALRSKIKQDTLAGETTLHRGQEREVFLEGHGARSTREAIIDTVGPGVESVADTAIQAPLAAGVALTAPSQEQTPYSMPEGNYGPAVLQEKPTVQDTPTSGYGEIRGGAPVITDEALARREGERAESWAEGGDAYERNKWFQDKLKGYAETKKAVKDVMYSGERRAEEQYYGEFIAEKKAEPEYLNASPEKRLLLDAQIEAEALMEYPLMAIDTAAAVTGDLATGFGTGLLVKGAAKSIAKNNAKGLLKGEFKSVDAESDRLKESLSAAIGDKIDLAGKRRVPNEVKSKKQGKKEGKLNDIHGHKRKEKLNEALNEVGDEITDSYDAIAALNKRNKKALKKQGDKDLAKRLEDIESGDSTFGLTVALQEGGANTAQVLEEIDQMSHEQLLNNEDYKREFEKEGNKERAKNYVKAVLGKQVFGQSGATALGISKLAGKFTGSTKPNVPTGGTTKRGVVAKTGGRILGETGEELAQTGTGTPIINNALQTIDSERSLLEGLGGELVHAGLGGAAGGTIVNAPRGAVDLTTTALEQAAEKEASKPTATTKEGKVLYRGVPEKNEIVRKAFGQDSSLTEVAKADFNPSDWSNSALNEMADSLSGFPKDHPAYQRAQDIERELNLREKQEALAHERGEAYELRDKATFTKRDIPEELLEGITAEAGSKEYLNPNDLGSEGGEINIALAMAKRALKNGDLTEEQATNVEAFINEATNVMNQRGLQPRKRKDVSVREATKKQKTTTKVAKDLESGTLDQSKKKKQAIQKAVPGALADNDSSTVDSSVRVLNEFTDQIHNGTVLSEEADAEAQVAEDEERFIKESQEADEEYAKATAEYEKEEAAKEEAYKVALKEYEAKVKAQQSEDEEAPQIDEEAFKQEAPVKPEAPVRGPAPVRRGVTPTGRVTTHGSSQEAVYNAKEANKKLVNSSALLGTVAASNLSSDDEIDAGGKVNNIRGKEAVDRVLETTVTMGRNIADDAPNIIANGDVDLLEADIAELNVRIEEKNRALNTKNAKTNKANSEYFVRATTAELNYLKDLKEYLKANIAISANREKFKDINWDATRAGPEIKGFTASDTFLGQRLEKGEEGNVELNATGRAQLFKGLEKEGVFDDINNPLSEIELTEDESRFLRNLSETKLPKDPGGKIAKSIIAKMNQSIKDNDGISANTLPQYLATAHIGVFRKAYTPARVIDDTEVVVVDEHELTRRAGMRHITEPEPEEKTLSEVRRLDKILEGFPLDNEKFPLSIVSPKSSQNAIEKAIKQRIDAINSPENKVPNVNVSGKSAPVPATPKYSLMKGLISKAGGQLSKLFKSSNKASLAGSTHNLLGHLSSDNQANKQLTNGLNKEERKIISKMALALREASDKAVKGYTKALNKGNAKATLELLEALDDHGKLTHPVLNMFYSKDSNGELQLDREALKELMDSALLVSSSYAVTEASGNSADSVSEWVGTMLGIEKDRVPKGTGGVGVKSGIPMTLFNDTLGKQLIRSLGIKGGDVDYTTGKDMERLQTALGKFAQQALQDLGYIKTKSFIFTREGQSSFKSRPATVKDDFKKLKPGTKGFTMVEFDKKAMGDAAVSGTVLTNYLTRLTGTNPSRTSAVTSKEDAKFKKTSNSALSPEHQEAVDEYQKKNPAEIDTDFLKTLLNMDEDYLKRLMGIEPDESNLMEIEKLAHESNLDTFNRVITLLKDAASNPEEFKELYQSFNISSNLRLNESSGLSGQANKLVRQVLHGVTETYTMDKPRDMKDFKVAIALGFDVDKLGSDYTTKWFDDRFNNDPSEVPLKKGEPSPDEFTRAAYAARKMFKGEETSDEDKELVQEVVATGDLAVETFMNLVAAGEYLHADLTDKPTFTARTFTEDDGIANGIAITILNHGIITKATADKNSAQNFIELLSRVGVSLGDTLDINAIRNQNKGDEKREAGTYDDIYKFYASPIGQKIKQVGNVRNPDNSTEDIEEGVYTIDGVRDDRIDPENVKAVKEGILAGDFESMMRTYTKYPMLMLVYGSGEDTMKADIHANYAKDLIERVSKLRKKFLTPVLDENGKDTTYGDRKLEFKAELEKINKVHADAAKYGVRRSDNTLYLLNTPKKHIRLTFDDSTGDVTFEGVTHYPSASSKSKSKNFNVKDKSKSKSKSKSYSFSRKKGPSTKKLVSSGALADFLGDNLNTFFADAVVASVVEDFDATRKISNHVNEATSVLAQQYVHFHNELLNQAIATGNGEITLAQERSIREKVDAAFPGVRSALSSTDENIFDSTITPIKQDLVKGQDSYSVAAIDKDGKAKKTNPMYTNKVNTKNGVSSPLFIHGLDATAVIRALQKDNKILQVFDGLVRSPKQEGATKAANEAFYSDILGAYNIIGEIVRSINHAQKSINSELGYSGNINDMLGDRATIKGAPYLDDQNRTVQQVYTLQDVIEHLTAQSEGMARYKAKLKSLVTTVNQYNNKNGGETYKIDPSLNVEEEVNAMLEDYAKVVENADRAKADLGEIVEVTEPNKKIKTAGIYSFRYTATAKQRRAQLKKREESAEGKKVGVDSQPFKVYFNGIVEAVVKAKKKGTPLQTILNRLYKEAAGLTFEEQAYAEGFLINEMQLQEQALVQEIASEVAAEIEGNEEGSPETDNETKTTSTGLELNEDGSVEYDFSAITKERNNEAAENSLLPVDTDLDEVEASEAEGTTVHGNSPLSELAIDVDPEANFRKLETQDALEVFDSLLSENTGTETAESAEHTNHLRSLIGSLGHTYAEIAHSVSLQINRRKDGGVNTGTARISPMDMQVTMNLRKGSAPSLSMSAQETFAHEYTHGFWRWGLDHSKGVRDEAYQIFESVAESIPHNELYKLFLDRNNPTAEDISIAKERADYVFGDIQEFLTYASTNENFRNNIAKHVIKKTNPKTKGFFNRLFSLLGKIAGYIFSDLRSKDLKDKTVDTALENLFLRTQSVLTRGRMKGIGTKMFDRLDTALDKSDDAIKKGAARLMRNVIDPDELAARNKVVEHRGEGEPLTMPEIIGELTRQNLEGLTDITNQGVRDIFTSIGGNAVDLAKGNQLIAKATKSVESASNSIRESYLSVLSSIGSRELNADEHAVTTNVIGKTDLGVIFDYGYTLDDLSSLMDPLTSKGAIQSIESELGKFLAPRQIRALIAHANATANYLVHDNTDLGTYNQNPTFIVKRVSKYVGPIQDEDRAINLVDVLITLQALQTTPQEDKDAFKALVADKGTRPKVDALVALQREVRSQALSSEFNEGREVYYRKGHYSQVTDKAKGVQLAPVSSRTEMLKAGYALKAKKKVPAGILGPKEQWIGVYVSPHGGNVAKSNAAFSSVQSGKYGESISSLMQVSGAGINAEVIDVNAAKYERMMLKETLAFADNKPMPKDLNTDIHPVPTPTGSPKEFRLNMIDTKFKKKHLGLKEDLGQSYATTASKMMYREKAPIHNDIVIDSLVETYKRDYAKNPKAFYVISPNTDNEDFLDAYNTIHPSARAKLKSVFGDKNIYVKKNQYTAIFGYRMPTVANMARNDVREDNALKEFTRILNNLLVPFISGRFGAGIYVEKGAQAVASEVAKAIVVKSGSVAFVNAVSGLALTSLMGMNTIKTLKDSTTGIIEGISYLNLERKKQDYLTKAGIARSGEKPDLAKADKLTRRANRIDDKLRQSPIHQMVLDGHLNTVVQDASTNKSNEFNARGKVREKADKYILNPMPKILSDVVKTALVLEDSSLFNAMQLATVMTDFGFKYATKLHMEAEGKSNSYINQKLHHYFVGYDSPSPRPVAYLESLGPMMFTKFAFRAQRITTDAFAERPARAVGTFFWQNVLSDLDTVFSGSWLLDKGPQRMFYNPFSQMDALVNTAPLNVLEELIPLTNKKPLLN